MKLILGILAAVSFIAAIVIGAFASRLESPFAHIWAQFLGKPLAGKKPSKQPLIIWAGFLVFLCIGASSAAMVEILDPLSTIVPPPITIVAPTNNGITQNPPSFSPIVEEFSSSENFTQTSSGVYIEGDQVNCNVSRSGGDQFVYKTIPEVSGDFRFTVIGQINSWTNNCGCKVGIGNQVDEGIFIMFGWFGGGCPDNGPTIIPGGGLSKTFDHSCSLTDDWPWFESNIPYRASVEIKGVEATLFVEGQKVNKYFGTNTYSGSYDTLWVGLKGDGDWPECTITTALSPILFNRHIW